MEKTEAAFNKFLRETDTERGPGVFPMPRPRVICEDGFSVSIQANEYAYCAPRETGCGDAYSAFELGFPSEHDDLLKEYIENLENDAQQTKSVFGWVPREVVLAVLKKHGGIEKLDWEGMRKCQAKK